MLNKAAIPNPAGMVSSVVELSTRGESGLGMDVKSDAELSLEPDEAP